MIKLFAKAIRTLGEATDEELSQYLLEHHGVRIETKYIPILRASLVDKRRNKPTKPAPQEE